MRRRRDEIDSDMTEGDITPAAGAVTDSPTQEFEKYLVHLAHLDMPLSMKIEFIRTIGDMMQNFVDRAFGNDPTQQALEASSMKNNSEVVDSGMIELPNPKNNLDNISDIFGVKARRRKK